MIDFEMLKRLRRALENVARAIDAFVEGLRKFFVAFPHIEMELLREPAGRLDFSLARPVFAAPRQRARAGGVWSGPSTAMRRRPRSW